MSDDFAPLISSTDASSQQEPVGLYGAAATTEGEPFTAAADAGGDAAVGYGINAAEQPQKKKSLAQTRFLTLLKFTCLGLVFVVLVAAVVTAVLLLKFFKVDTFSNNLNIHVKVSAECERAAVLMNARATQLDPNQQIDFVNKTLPHITLYLTDFYVRNIPSAIAAINATIAKWKAEKQPVTEGTCQIYAPAQVDATGAYAMWKVLKTSDPTQQPQAPACMQFLSDGIVNTTVTLIDDQTRQIIPPWIWGLPADVQRRKIEMIRLYGSPNVYSEFDPHVTLAHDDVTPTALKQAIDTMREAGQIVSCSFTPTHIAIGRTYLYGTVKRNEDIAVFPLQIQHMI